MRGDHPAFPATIDVNDEYRPGMSMRAWLAGQALAGIAGHCCAEGHSVPDTAATAVQYADAVLAELNKPAD